ncbi:hypothetical protein ILYODFUR_035461 [Ilyodon furcidens]|uniref:Uncharacterized protein n=1 Tax=Ilyodon furcidens TaxID=33524 RepID=A0ABV0TPJ7_9TELE
MSSTGTYLFRATVVIRYFTKHCHKHELSKHFITEFQAQYNLDRKKLEYPERTQPCMLHAWLHGVWLCKLHAERPQAGIRTRHCHLIIEEGFI